MRIASIFSACLAVALAHLPATDDAWAYETGATVAVDTRGPPPPGVHGSCNAQPGNVPLRCVIYEGTNPPNFYPEAFPYGGLTNDGHRLQPRTLYSSAEATLTGVEALGGHLTASKIGGISQSGADPDAAAASNWWSLEQLVLRSDPGGPDLISWTGSSGPSPQDHPRLTDHGNPFHRYLNHAGSHPPPQRPSLDVSIQTPEGRVTETLTCGDSQELCDSTGRPRVPLLDADLYDGTPLQDAFESIGPELTSLRASQGPLQDLELIAGRSSVRTDGDSFARGRVSGLSAEFIEGGEEVRVAVGSASTYADSEVLRTGLSTEYFEVTPSECSSAIDPADCPGVSTDSTQLPSPSNRPPGISGVSHSAGSGAGSDNSDQFDGGAIATPESSVDTVGELLPPAGGSGQVADLAGGGDTEGVSGEGEDGGSGGQQPLDTDGNGSAINAAAVTPSVGAAREGGSLAPWLLGTAGVVLLTLGFFRWQQGRNV